MSKNIVKMAAGLLMILSVLIGYMPQPEYLVELTCVSNTLGGLLLLADGILGITKNKNFPNSFYHNIAVSIFIVFLVCMGSFSGVYKFNFNGAFFFMHIINPIMIMIYLLFDYIRCQFIGEFVYGFVDPKEITFFYAIIVGFVTYIIVYLLSLCLFALNRLAHKRAADDNF